MKDLDWKLYNNIIWVAIPYSDVIIVCNKLMQIIIVVKNVIHCRRMNGCAYLIYRVLISIGCNWLGGM